jgi:hypothetical protein
LSRRTLNYVAGIVHRDRKAIGSAGFGVGVSTAWRYVNEVLPLLAARAPKLRRAVRAPGERANTQLKQWGVLRKLRCCPRSAELIARAIHTLIIQEAKAA